MLVNGFENRRFRTLSPVISGRWDSDTKPLQNYDLFYSVYHHFAENISWENTDFYHRVKNEIESTAGWNKWSCENLQDFQSRLSSLDDLYNRIESTGYKTQRQLRNDDNDIIGTRECLPPEWHEITIHVDRNGELILHEGRHRLAISQALELEQIPVRIMVRHKSWQSKRTELYQNNQICDNSLLEHPDMADLD